MSLIALFALAAMADQPEILSAHNQVRAKLGLPALTWSVPLENVARNWAESLLANGKFEHSPHSRYGENLFEIRGASASPAEVVEAWVDESRDFNAKANTCRAGAVCGHYTQVVWRSTREVGCAVARGRGREVWVCEYNPPGNYVGERPF